MTDKEVNELRRQYRPEKTNIRCVKGCYVNEKGEIVSTFSQSLLDLTEEETAGVLNILKKSLSGGVSRCLRDIAFSNHRVESGEEHKLLMTLRDSELENEEALRMLYERMASLLHYDHKYLILLAHEKMDVFAYRGDGEKEEDSTSVFSYFNCAVCPVKQSKSAIGFASHRNAFCGVAGNTLVGAPELGFTFPAFDDRKTNIYNALFYARDTENEYAELISTLFCAEPPMPSTVQKHTFQAVLSESIKENCSMTVVEAVQEQISDMVQIHKESRIREPLTVSKNTVADVLRSCDVPEETVVAFHERYDREFGIGTEIPPSNTVETKRYELKTPDVVIKVNPARTDLVTTQVIDGVKYILVRADESVSLNGVNISIS